MARRKAHPTGQLKKIVLAAAERLLTRKGTKGLTARALAAAIGYAPGTIYNVYKDMDALLTELNYETLGRLYDFCRDRAMDAPANGRRVQALAHAYIDFAHENPHAWECLFAAPPKSGKASRVPKNYQQRLADLFALIESVLQECLGVPADEAAATARLLWACLHGIATLTLDGRLKRVGIEQPHDLIETMLKKQLADYWR